jgi:hypothetical protein
VSDTPPTLTQRIQAIRDLFAAVRPHVRQDGDDEVGRLLVAIDQAEAAAIDADKPPQG